MSYVSQKELNFYVRNMQDQIGISTLENKKADVVRKWLINNLSNIGRYSHRDFERFGNLTTIEDNPDHFDRQDGWVALTEEVPHIDHLTYGTGITYIHGEMELPDYDDNRGDNMVGDEFYHVDKTGGTKHIYEDVVEFRHWEQVADGGPMVGYQWQWTQETPTGTIGDGRWLFETITENVGGEYIEEKIGVQPEGTKTTPTIFNDEDVYNVDNERNHYPWIVINSSQPESLKKHMEDEFEGKNGMYDEELPQLAKQHGTYPPVREGGIKFTKGGIKGILDFISPINETPE